MPLSARPISYKDACQYIANHHRHHKPPQGWKYGTSAVNGEGEVVGVVMVGRPVSRMMDDGETVEVTRLCTDGTKNTASFLYGIAKRVARELGYKRIITYTLEEEEGTTLRAAGWQRIRTTAGGSWSRESRPREDKAPLVRKVLWEG
jgi:hypothetical protein